MLPTPNRLRKKRDYDKLSTKGRSIYGVFATLRFRELGSGETKVGFITSTKMFKRAVDRNRIKRRLREVIRLMWNDLPKQMHLLFVPKPEALTGDFDKIQEDIRHMLSKIPETLKKPVKISPGARRWKEKKAAKKAAKNP